MCGVCAVCAVYLYAMCNVCLSITGFWYKHIKEIAVRLRYENYCLFSMIACSLSHLPIPPLFICPTLHHFAPLFAYFYSVSFSVSSSHPAQNDTIVSLDFGMRTREMGVPFAIVAMHFRHVDLPLSLTINSLKSKSSHSCVSTYDNLI